MTLRTDTYKDIKGPLAENANMGARSWFRCGGHADLLFNPEDAEDLSNFLKQHPTNEPITIVGGLANTIVRDGGIRGATIQLRRPFGDIAVDETYPKSADEIYISAGAGAMNTSIASFAAKNGIGGLEFLSGIPGSLGGALRMNAGAYGSDISNILVAIYALDMAGNKFCLTQRGKPLDPSIELEPNTDLLDINLSYRNNDAPHYLIFTSAILRGHAENNEAVSERIADIKEKRNNTQPIKEKTGGSTFANPHPESLKHAGLPEDMRAWQVVEKVGGRGLTIGGAKMSEKHSNFMINTGDATAKDLEMLGEEIKTRAYNDLGLELHWEIKRIGEKA